MIAFTRDVSDAIVRCELTHLARQPIDLARARAEHRAYEARLAALGCDVRRLAAAPDLPDAVFVEDTAVVVGEVAVLARPGAASRRPELASMAEALAPLRPIVRVEAPGTLEGGDVLRVGRTLFVGRSSRTNDAGFAALRATLAPYGYDVRQVPVHGCLHLKSAVTEVGGRRLVVNRAWVDADAFAGYDLVDVDPAEPFAANALRVGGTVIQGAQFPRTRARLAARGVEVEPVDLSELAKAEGGVTCCCVILDG
jgi:dimethylargininase